MFVVIREKGVHHPLELSAAETFPRVDLYFLSLLRKSSQGYQSVLDAIHQLSHELFLASKENPERCRDCYLLRLLYCPFAKHKAAKHNAHRETISEGGFSIRHPPIRVCIFQYFLFRMRKIEVLCAFPERLGFGYKTVEHILRLKSLPASASIVLIGVDYAERYQGTHHFNYLLPDSLDIGDHPNDDRPSRHRGEDLVLLKQGIDVRNNFLHIYPLVLNSVLSLLSLSISPDAKRFLQLIRHGVLSQLLDVDAKDSLQLHYP